MKLLLSPLESFIDFQSEMARSKLNWDQIQVFQLCCFLLLIALLRITGLVGIVWEAGKT